MHKIEFESSGRSMRWHEWLAGLFLLGLVGGVRAESVYKCVDAHGAIAYQAQTCDASQRQSVINIPPAPLPAPAPHYVLARQDEQAARPLHAARERASREMAYECRVSDGRVFYRLAACPHSIARESMNAAATSHHGKSGSTRSSGGAAQVASRRVPREEACREIHRAGAIGRDGHEFDEHVSTYERNLGHDPCKS